MTSRAPVYVLEGTWSRHGEVAVVLPYFSALAASHSEIDLSHRTIRGAEDIEHYVSKISKNAGAFLYFACHGKGQRLLPSDGRSPVQPDLLMKALGSAKPGAISFVHFGCCEMVHPTQRREDHARVLSASRARWVSGYTKDVDWLPSMLFDLALVSEVFVPFHESRGRSGPRIKKNAVQFMRRYKQLAKELGFSALSRVTGGTDLLFPGRVRS